MPQLYSNTVDTEQLLAQVRQRCAQPATGPAQPASALPAARPPRLPSLPVRAWRAFQASGYSWRWAVGQVPGAVPVYLFMHTLLGLRHTLDTLQQQQYNTQKTTFHQHQQFEKQIQQLRQQQEKLQRDNTHLRKRLVQAEKTAAQCLASADPASALLPGGDPEQLAHWYSAFEEAQRGQVSDIAQRQAQYLPLVAPALQGQAPALDLGCGRGEWVQLLSSQGHPSCGVDGNPAMLAPAQAAGAQVHCQDLFAYLAEQASEHYALVTSFQVVEHLPLAQLLQMLHEAYRVLRPGGMLLLETPNPENLQVGAYSFWMDPTHQRPLPPPLLLQMAQHAGFVDCHIHRSSPWPLHAQTPGLPEPLPKLLYAEQDYALLARKPHPAPATPAAAQTAP